MNSMMSQPITPSRWYYLLSLFIVSVGAGLFFLIMFKGLSGIPDKLAQMEAPGTAEMTFAEPGKYTVFYEHRSVIEGKVYDTGENLSGLWVTVVSKETGSPVPLVQPSVSTSYEVGNRAGVSVLEFNIERPGVYQVSATYPDNKDGQRVAMAVGQGVAGRITATIISGLATMFGSVLLAIVISVITFVKRRRAKKALTWRGYPTYPPAFAPR
jgi:hypothetical protein